MTRCAPYALAVSRHSSAAPATTSRRLRNSRITGWAQHGARGALRAPGRRSQLLGEGLDALRDGVDLIGVIELMADRGNQSELEPGALAQPVEIEEELLDLVAHDVVLAVQQRDGQAAGVECAHRRVERRVEP